MSLAHERAWANIVRKAKPQMRQGIDQHAAEEDEAGPVAVGKKMPHRPEGDTNGERKAQALAQAAPEQEDAEAEKTYKHQDECHDLAPGRRIIDRNKGRHAPTEYDQGERD